jgi:excinuclease ABC subunit B
MAENLAEYLREIGVRCRYLHSDINAIERVEILRGLRKGEFDVLIGINLLREGLDLVEVSLVAILDADKEGFLRSTRSLIQTMGRAARNVNGRVILYADRETDSIRAAVAETERRRKIQAAFNAEHGIVPRSAKSEIRGSLIEAEADLAEAIGCGDLSIEVPKDKAAQDALVTRLRKEMFDAAAKREFEKAAALRDALNTLQDRLLKI